MVNRFAAIKRFCCGLLIVAVVVISAVARAVDSTPVRIGVLTKGNEVLTMQRWPATAEYLQARIPAYKFKIVPLDLHQIDVAVKARKIDFLLTNPVSFVDMESEYGVNAVLSLNSRLNEKESLSTFAGVIFTAIGRNDIQSLNDLKDKTFAAVDETSFGGWAMAWREMKGNGFEPYENSRSQRLQQLEKFEMVSKMAVLKYLLVIKT